MCSFYLVQCRFMFAKCKKIGCIILKIKRIWTLNFFNVTASIWTLLASWSGVFRIGESATLPMVSLIIMAITVAFHPSIKFDFAKLGFLFVTFSILILLNLFQVNIKTVNYLVYIGFFTSIYIIVQYARTTSSSFLNLVNFLSVSLILIVIMVKYLALEFLILIWIDYVPRSKENTAGLGAGLIKRAYGFSTEPTQVGNYLLTCGLLAISYTATPS